MLTWELIGAVVGAGLASGREIASFFSQYGLVSYVGITLAVLMLIWLANTSLPESWHNTWLEGLWKTLLSLLLIATGGAMLSGAGEIASRMLPISCAWVIGVAGTIVLAWLISQGTMCGLAWVSRLLLCILAGMILLGVTVPPMRAAHLDTAPVPEAMVRSICYGGFNAALQVPIINGERVYSAAERRKSTMYAGGIFFCLLQLGNAVLLRHPALLAEEMPYIRIMKEFGGFGYHLGAVCLYLAVLSTLTACMRGFGGKILPTAAVVLVSLLGFSGVVEMVYPLLGGGCFLMLLAAKFTNSCSKPFHLSRNVL